MAKPNPLSIACPVCNADSGERCRTGGASEYDDEGNVTKAGYNHYPRGQEHGDRLAAVSDEG